MRASVRVACVQAEPVVFDREATIAKLEGLLLHAARQRFDPAGHYHRPDVLSLTVHQPA